MPSPFPGMDPYLENSEFFPELHDALITYLREALQRTLPHPYFAKMQARVWIEPSRRSIEPDVDVLRDRGPARSSAGTAMAVARPPIAVPAAGDEVHESFLEIRTTKGEYPLVTAIEILSPTNKTPGVHGRTLYHQKQEELLRSRVNLVEIDLLRGGHHTTAVSYNDAVAKGGPFDYHVCVRQMDDLDNYFVYPIRLQEQLPELLIPLLPGDEDVKVDLQAVFTRSYDTGPYQVEYPYRFLPEPPLPSDQAIWAENVLREKGLLPTPPALP